VGVVFALKEKERIQNERLGNWKRRGWPKQNPDSVTLIWRSVIEEARTKLGPGE